jgi:hypothetical protein
MKEKSMFASANDCRLPHLREVVTLLNQLTEADRTEILRHLIRQPIDQTMLGEVLESIAHSLANVSLVDDSDFKLVSETVTQRKMPFSKGATVRS